MKYPETAQRLREAISEANMIPQELADRSGVSKSSISQYLNGSHKPSNLSSGRMAKVLGVDPVWLMGLSDIKTKPTDVEQIAATFEMFNKTHPDLPTYREKTHFLSYKKLMDKYKDQIDAITNQLLLLQEREEAVQASKKTRRYVCYHRIAAAGTGFYFDDIPSDTIEAPDMELADFVIGVSGDSMEPTFSDGDYVYVKKTHELAEGEIGIFVFNGECYIKEYQSGCLVSHNKAYPNIPGSADIKCFGKVLGKVKM